MNFYRSGKDLNSASKFVFFLQITVISGFTHRKPSNYHLLW